MKDLNLLGKDYFSQAEAAHYCCMSLSQFQLVAPKENVWPIAFGGKLLYRRSDLQRAIETKWQHSEKPMAPGLWTGGRTASDSGRSSAESTRSTSLPLKRSSIRKMTRSGIDPYRPMLPGS